MPRAVLTGAVALLCSATLLSSPTQASSHREAPNVTRMSAVDSTDFYMFNSYEPGRSGYVTILANYVPLQDAYGGPNYFALDATALYEIHIDSDGDAKENLSFQIRVDNDLANRNRGLKLPIGASSVAVPLKNIGPVSAADQSALNFTEQYSLGVVRGDRRSGSVQYATDSNGKARFAKPYDFVGTKTFGSVNGYKSYARSFIHTVNFPGCSLPGKVFVGQRKDGFAVNLGQVFDLVNLVPIDGKAFPGGIMQSPANNVLADKNVTTIALEIHRDCLKGNGNGVIGGWTSASLRQVRILNPRATFEFPEVSGGAWTQVSRLGMPLVNEVVIGLPDKDRFSSSEPKDDGQFATYVTNPTLPALINVLFKDAVNQTLSTNFSTIAPTNLPRNDLVTTFLTGFKGVNQLATVTPSEMLRLNTLIEATPAAGQSAFGVAGGDLAGFPNGRRPGDDVVDIELRVAMGALCYPLTIAGNSTDLGLCKPADAPVGNAPITDGAPMSSADFDSAFPYLRTPLPGAGGGAMGGN
ncbi:MAG: DUF4331 domain-containing protein [Pseudomonadales bacterium]|nr:DUF4331 domain-containing protein [Pseudomonadales bacterium]